MRAWNTVDRLMQEGVTQGTFPGAVLRVSVGDLRVFERSYGWADLFSGRAMTVDTVFDLASLTKPLATTLAVMALVSSGRLALDDTCASVWPETAGTDKAGITIRQLLCHQSGLPAWRPFFLRLLSVPVSSRLTELKRMLLSEPLEVSPGTRSDYSDLGFMLMQWLVERTAGEGLSAFVEREVYRPLGISGLYFNETAREVAEPHRYAATQLCPWRNRLLVGQVDDDNAWIAGGVGGHAGLFGTAGAVGSLLEALTAADQGSDGAGVFDPIWVRRFLKSGPQVRWALGFDTPSRKDSSSGHYFPEDSIGHLGFTGTSFWVHRSKKIIVVLLTNRVHPYRYHAGIKAFRPRLHDAVMKAVQV